MQKNYACERACACMHGACVHVCVHAFVACMCDLYVRACVYVSKDRRNKLCEKYIILNVEKNIRITDVRAP